MALDIIERNGPYAEKIKESLCRSGFAVVRFPLLAGEARSLCAEWKKQFFAMSDGEKAVYIADARGAGYFAAGRAEKAVGAEEQDWKEYFHIYPGKDEAIPVALLDLTLNYFDHAYTWGTAILKAMGVSLAPSSQDSLLRVLHYPAAKGKRRVVAAPHEDINVLTVLPASGEPGLEVLCSGKFVPVPCGENLVVLNCGDGLSGHDNTFTSATHRVVRSTEQGSRMSIPLFIHCGGDTILRDQKITAGDALRRRLDLIDAGDPGV